LVHSTSNRGAAQKSRHLRALASYTTASVPTFIQDPDAADDPTPHRVVVLYKEGTKEGFIADLDLVEAVINDTGMSNSLPPFAFQDGLVYKLHHEMDKWNLLAFTASTSILKWLAEKEGSSVEVMELDQIREASNNSFLTSSYPKLDSLGHTGSGLGYSSLSSTTEPISFWPLNMIQALDLFEKSFNGDGVTICIVDSGVNDTKAGFDSTKLSIGESLIPNFNWQSSEPDDCAHGTQVSGIIAGNGAADGPLGVAHGANIAVVRVLNDSCGSAHVSDILMASLACHSKYDARIINIGLSGVEYSMLEEAIMEDATLTEDILFVAAAGDEGGVDDLYPAANEHVFSVASVDMFEDVAFNSQSNFHVDIAAPGFRVGTLDFASDAVAYGWGTDMAAAFVSGIAAVLLSAMPDKTLSEVRSAIEKTAKRMGAEDYDADDNGSRNNDYGHGIVKANAAMNCLLDDTKCAPFKALVVPADCVDVPEGWHDVDGPEFDCEWYSLYDRCAILGDKFVKWDDVSASQACCMCGGGQRRIKWITLSQTSFENEDWGEWMSADGRASHSDLNAFSGSFSLRLEGGSFTPRPNLLHNVVDVTNLMQLQLTFSFKLVSLSKNEGIWVQKSLDNGLNWITVAKFSNSVSLDQHPPFVVNVEINEEYKNINVPVEVALGEERMILAIKMYASRDLEGGYIDDVILKGKERVSQFT